MKSKKSKQCIKAKRVVVITDLLQADKDELLTFWLADQVTVVVEDEKSNR
jgi:hypothetical protein